MTAAKKDSTKPVVPWQPEAPKAEVKKEVTPQAAPAAPQPTKQQQTLDKLKDAWTKRGMDLSKLKATPDGKNLNVVVADGWPTIVIGTAGGINLPQIKSYPKAFDAAVIADELLKKQIARATPKPVPTPSTDKVMKAAHAEAPKAVSTTEKKSQAHQQLEKKLDAAAQA